MKLLLNKFKPINLLKQISFKFTRLTKQQPNTIVNQFTDMMQNQNQNQPTTNGRCWRAQQLRLKSNEDLHKLWYVCVKEKNLLLADQVLNLKVGDETSDTTKYRLKTMKKTMNRIITVVGQRQKVKAQFRRQLEEQYIAKKKKQLEEKLSKQPQPLPQITAQMLRTKYLELRKGIDNVQYLERLWEKKDHYQKKRERMEQRLASGQPKKQFKSYFQKEMTIDQKPMQEEILREHVKNWKMLNFKQRKIILGFLNARRAKDAKSAFLKQLKILSQQVAKEQITKRINV